MTSVIDTNLCSGCGRCKNICRQDCIFPAGGSYRIEQFDCIDCAACREVCPTGAARLDG